MMEWCTRCGHYISEPVYDDPVPHVVKAAAELWNVPVNQLLSPSRKAAVVAARHPIMAVLYHQYDLTLADMLSLDSRTEPLDNPDIPALAERIIAAKERGAAVILTMGAHVVRKGLAPFIIDLMERGYLSHIAMNGAGPIHDFEFAAYGETTEDVARYIQAGEFGLWEELAQLNEAAKTAAAQGIGLGEQALMHSIRPEPAVDVARMHQLRRNAGVDLLVGKAAGDVFGDEQLADSPFGIGQRHGDRLGKPANTRISEMDGRTAQAVRDAPDCQKVRFAPCLLQLQQAFRQVAKIQFAVFGNLTPDGAA